MNLGPHAGFILGAYAFTALVVGGLIGQAFRDRRVQIRALAALQDASEPEASATAPPASTRPPAGVRA